MQRADPVTPPRAGQRHLTSLLQTFHKCPRGIAFGGMNRRFVKCRAHHLRSHRAGHGKDPFKKTTSRITPGLRAGCGIRLQPFENSGKGHRSFHSPATPRAGWGGKGKGHGAAAAHTPAPPPAVRRSTTAGFRAWMAGLSTLHSRTFPDHDRPSGISPERPPLPLRGQRRNLTGFPILRPERRHLGEFTLAGHGNAGKHGFGVFPERWNAGLDPQNLQFHS